MREFSAKAATHRGNRGVVYVGPNKVEVREIGYPKLEEPSGRKANHGVILKCLATNICG
jgi:glutathione-independent formaldehyde dehydrogenase